MRSFKGLALVIALAVTGPASAWAQSATTGAGGGPHSGGGGAGGGGASTGAGSVSYVQSAGATTQGGGQSQTIALASNSGNGPYCLAISTRSSGSSGPSSVTDTNSDTFTLADSDYGSAGVDAASYYAVNLSASPTSVTVSWSSSTGGLLVTVDEYGNCRGVDGHIMQSSIAPVGPTLNSGNVTTTVNGDRIWGGAIWTQGALHTGSPGSGFTARLSQNIGESTMTAYNPGGGIEYWNLTEDQSQAAAGSVSASVTLNFTVTAGGADAFLIAFHS